MISNKDAYNAIADQWSAQRDTSNVSRLVTQFASHLKSGGKILDIGCGTGFPNMTWLAEQGFVVTGIDFAALLLQKAKERHIRQATLYCCDFFDFETVEKFDGILAFDSFFHFPKEKQTQIYTKVAAWMKTGAYLLFTHGLNDDVTEGEMFSTRFYYSSLDKNHVLQILDAAGLEVIWTKEKYVEYDLERDLVVLARKR